MASDDDQNGWAAVVQMGQATAAAVQAATSAMVSLQASMSEVKDGLRDVRSEVGDLTRDVSSLRTETFSVRTDMMGRLDRLQDKLSAVTDDLTVNYVASVKSERAARIAQDEARAYSDQLTAVRLQIRRLSAKVFGPDDLH